jgi:hypothetical protein
MSSTPQLPNPMRKRLMQNLKPGRRRRRQFRKAGFKTKGEAQKALTKLRASLDTGTYTEPSKVLLGDYALQWLQRRKTTGNGLKDTTAANYVRYIRDDIIPSKLGQMKLTDIRRAHINAFVAELIAARRGAVTVRRILARLQTILATAVLDEIIPTNPARLTARSPSRAPRPKLACARFRCLMLRWVRC